MTSVYQIITEQILNALEKGTVPWRKPWSVAGSGVPQRLGGAPYRGLNALLLWMTAYGSPYFVTFNQVSKAGGKVRKGEKGHLITAMFPQTKTLTNEQGEEQEVTTGFKVRYYKVWNLEQLEHLGSLKVPATGTREFTPVQEAEAIIAAWADKPTIQHQYQRAFYRPADDLINMPARDSFISDAEYYCTLFHEFIHATESRVGRTEYDPANRKLSYAFEELVAEIGASILMSQVGLFRETIDNSAAYIAGWKAALKGDSYLIIRAASEAQKGVDYILGKGQAVEQVEEASV